MEHHKLQSSRGPARAVSASPLNSMVQPCERPPFACRTEDAGPDNDGSGSYLDRCSQGGYRGIDSASEHVPVSPEAPPATKSA